MAMQRQNREVTKPYVPPHRRRATSGEETNSQQSLEQLASARLKLILRWTSPSDVADVPIDLESCPFRISQPPTPYELHVMIWRGVLKEEGIMLLRWCKEQPIMNSNFELEFPSQLTKNERASWHHAAEACNLSSLSEGLGESRKLIVRGKYNREELKDPEKSLAPELRKHVSAIHNRCQFEGGKAAEISRNEIAEIIQGNGCPSIDITMDYDNKDVLELKEFVSILHTKVKEDKW